MVGPFPLWQMNGDIQTIDIALRHSDVLQIDGITHMDDESIVDRGRKIHSITIGIVVGVDTLIDGEIRYFQPFDIFYIGMTEQAIFETILRERIVDFTRGFIGIVLFKDMIRSSQRGKNSCRDEPTFNGTLKRESDARLQWMSLKKSHIPWWSRSVGLQNRLPQSAVKMDVNRMKINVFIYLSVAEWPEWTGNTWKEIK